MYASFTVASIVALLLVAYLGWRNSHYLIPILIAAFLTRLLIILVDSELGLLAQPPIAPGHYERSVSLSASWLEGEFSGSLPDVGTMRSVVAHVLAPFHIVYGPYEYVGRVAIAAYSLLVGYLVYRIGAQLTTYRNALIATALTLFWPSVVYRSVVIQREILVTVLVLTVVLISVRWTNRVRTQEALLLILVSVGIFALRKENLVIIAFTVTAGVLANEKVTLERGFFASLLAMPALALFVLNFGQFTGFGTTLTPEAIDQFAHGRDHGSSAYLVNLHYESWLDIVLYAPMKVVYFLFGPLPSYINGLTTLLASLSGLGVLVAVVLSRRGIAIVLSNDKEKLAVVLVFLTVGVLSYSIIEMNFGAAFRRRIQFVPLIVLLGTVGLPELRVRWRSSRGK